MPAHRCSLLVSDDGAKYDVEVSIDAADIGTTGTYSRSDRLDDHRNEPSRPTDRIASCADEIAPCM